MFNLVGKFEGVNIYESQLIGNGHGITIPEFGIFVSKGTFQKDLWLIKHEFGHILQHRETGSIKFYQKIGAPSLWSAILQHLKKEHNHQTHPVEIDANLKSYQYFNQPKDWPFHKFPINSKK